LVEIGKQAVGNRISVERQCARHLSSSAFPLAQKFGAFSGTSCADTIAAKPAPGIEISKALREITRMAAFLSHQAAEVSGYGKPTETFVGYSQIGPRSGETGFSSSGRGQ